MKPSRIAPFPGFRTAVRALVILVGGLLLAGACSRIDKGVRITPSRSGTTGKAAIASVRYSDFRQAFENFDFSAVDASILDAGSRALMDGMLLVMSGELAGAEAVFRRLSVSDEDAWKRAVATDILVQLFYFQGKWKSLHEMFAPEPGRDNDAGENDLSFLKMSRVMAESCRFPSHPIVLPMELSPSGTPLVPLRINGRWEKFWLDTGSGFTILASDLADDVNIVSLQRSKSRAATSTNKRVATRLTVIESLQIGDLEISRHPAMIVQKKDLFFKIPGHFRSRKITKNTGIRGVLGINAIKNMSIRLDFPNRRIIISRPGKNTAGIRNLFWMGYPILVCRGMDGTLLHFGLDTGAKQSVISANLLAKIRPAATYHIRLKVWGAGGEMKIKTQVLPELKISLSGHTAAFRDIVVLPLNQFGFARLDGILGSDFLAACGTLNLDMANGLFAIEKLPGRTLRDAGKD